MQSENLLICLEQEAGKYDSFFFFFIQTPKNSPLEGYLPTP